MEHDNPLQNTSAGNDGGLPAEGANSSDIAATGGLAALKAASGGSSSLPVLSAEDLRKGGLSLLDLPSAAAGSDGGLMIDGFMVPPHVLQALKDLRMSPDSAAKLEHLAGSNQGALLSPPVSAGAAAEGQENTSPSSAGAVQSSPGSSPSMGGGNELRTSLSSGDSSTAKRARQQRAADGAAARCSTSSRGSSLDSIRGSHSSGRSGRSSVSNRSSRSSPLSGEESDANVASLEAAVEELTSRSSENAVVISRLGQDIVSLATTNEALRQRLTLLASQLRHREVEIDALKADVRRWRAAVIASNVRVAAG